MQKKQRFSPKSAVKWQSQIKEGGSANPDFNARLRDCIAKAKANNMPERNIKRTLDKYSGATVRSITRQTTTKATA